MFYPIGSMYGIYTNIGYIDGLHVTIYSSTMDPMGIFFVIFWGPQDCSRWKQRQDVVFVVREKRHPVFTREAMVGVGAMVGVMKMVSWYPWSTLWQQ